MSFTYPQPNQGFSSTANIVAEGTGIATSSSFVVQIVNGNNTVLQSAQATIQSNSEWSTTLNAPSNGWPKNSQLTVQAVCNGTVLASVKIYISSE